MRRIAILVLTCTNDGYDLMDECVRKTWGSITRPGVDIFYYYSQHIPQDEDYQVNGSTILCNGVEGYYTIGHKTIKALKYLKTKDYDFILRTNSSSFIHLDNLIKYIETLPNTEVYTGMLIPHHTFELALNFVTGSGYIISRDVLDLILSQSTNWNHNLPDDLALGVILKQNNINIIEKDWVKINTIPLSEVLLETLDNKFHIRCKIEDAFDCNTQCTIMQHLYKKIYL